MLKLKKIAVTGGLSAGKTTVCNIFKELGAYVVSADEIVHELLSPGSALSQKVANLLGVDIASEAVLDRKKIAAKVFSQPRLLHALEGLLHPAVFDEIEKRYQKVFAERTHPLFIAEVPLLFEVDGEEKFDAVISVLASPDQCRKRFVAHTDNPIEEFERRMQRQIAPEQKAIRAHFAIENNGTLEELRAQVKNLYTYLRENFKEGV
jgi:dephospho-CoA kinase